MIEKLNKDELKDRHLTGKSILAFRATWCPPCQMLGPELETLGNQTDDIKIFDFDVDKNVEFARELGVSSIPSLFYFQDGVQVEHTVGYLPKEEIVKKFK